MARPKKPAEDKPKEGAGITIDVNDYVRTRDQVRHSILSRALQPLHPHSSSSFEDISTRIISPPSSNVIITRAHHDHMRSG